MPNPVFSKRFSPGFTMIETLIAVLVIAILSAIALPQFQAFAYRSMVAEGMLQMNFLDLEELSFFSLEDRYGSFTDLYLVWESSGNEDANGESEWQRLANSTGSGGDANGGSGGWISTNGGSGENGDDVSSAKPAFGKYFVYTITLDSTKTRCTLSAQYQDGRVTILLSSLFENGSQTAPLSVLYHYF